MAQTRIMVVEDEGIVGLDIQNKLESLDYEVPEVVSTGELAVQKAEELHPDLVLMDIQLAGEMDGVQAAEQIRRRFNIPVVYLTAFSDDNTLQRAKSAEPFGYLLKPFAERELHTSIEVALYKHQIDEEKARLEVQLYQAQKMEAIGQLTTGIAHNFNNMLHGIMGNVDIALLSASDQLRPYLEAAQFDGQKAAQLIKQLMLFYHQEQSERESVEIAALIEEVVAMCREVFARKYAGKIDIEIQTEPDLPPLEGSYPRLRQCITNLCLNAQEALEGLPAGDPPSPYIKIAVSTVQFDMDARIPSPDANPGQYLRIVVADNGVGMDQATQERIFEPFFTTKGASQGAGLGLTMVYAIVKDYHGWVECDSKEGVGTTFSVHLPVSTRESSADEDAEAIPEIISGEEVQIDLDSLRGTEKVLVIADVDRFRRILTEMLEAHDYNVLLGINIRDGLDIFAHEKDKVGLVILDLSMPGVSSQELLAELLAIDAQAQVLIVTGYTTSSAAWIGARAILNKPFNSHKLLHTVRKILDR